MMPLRTGLDVGTGNRVTWSGCDGEMRPMEFGRSVNHRLPSGPGVTALGEAPSAAGSGNSVIV